MNNIAQLVMVNYDVGHIERLIRLSSGLGSNSYFVSAEKGEFILKDIEQNGMNHPENEALILNVLHNAAIPVSTICPTRAGDSVLRLESKVYHLQKYIAGETYNRNAAPEWLLYESAQMLGKIQSALEELPPLPIGIGQSFFDKMTPERARANYESTLKLACEKGDSEIVNAINYKIKTLGMFDGYKFDVSRMTCKNTHGDYKIHQIICGPGNIRAVIDFTSACVHPACWEVIRSYSLTDSHCMNGQIEVDNFKRYISSFLKHGTLSAYDLKIMPYVYYYQSLVSNHFQQYYHSSNANKDTVLDDAFFVTKQCMWFEQNITRLEDGITSGS